jgi:glycerol-3-phosphate dehydrogenase
VLPPPDPRAGRPRSATLARLADGVFDVLVVGGGATGASVARDAALRGLEVALCDRGDFGGETSGQSSKLIHGGLRYLEHGHLHLVFEALAERRRLMSTAPHLCRPVEFLFPAYRGIDPSLWKLTVGVALYDALALFRPPAHSRRLDPGEVHGLAPELRQEGLRGAIGYIDCQTDDARLVLENVLDAEAAGATVASYVEIEPPASRRGELHPVMARDRDSGTRFPVRARAILNATGPFSDAFRGGAPVLRPTLGVHLVVDAARLPTHGRAFVLRSPRDHRVMFVLPAGARTVVGTTDTDWPDGDGAGPRPGDEIRARGEDVGYLLETADHAFPALQLQAQDVLSTFSGLRPLLASDASDPSSTSREHAIWVDAQGVLTVAGGKLTTMRRMGEEAVDRLIELLRGRGVDRPLLPCGTRDRPLPGAVGWTTGEAATLSALHELGDDVRQHLLDSYGVRARQVVALAAEGDESLRRRLAPDLPHLTAEVVYAARHEHACEVEDVLCRRVPLFRLDRDQGLGCAGLVAQILAAELGWSPAREKRSVRAYRALVERSRRWRSEYQSSQPRSEGGAQPPGSTDSAKTVMHP